MDSGMGESVTDFCLNCKAMLDKILTSPDERRLIEAGRIIHQGVESVARLREKELENAFGELIHKHIVAKEGAVSKVSWFRSPAQEVTRELMRELRASPRSAASLAREAEVPERTARLWMQHPEKLVQLENVIALLWAAEVPEKTIAQILRRRGV